MLLPKGSRPPETARRLDLANRLVQVSHLLKGQDIGLEQIDDDRWRVYFSFYPLGRIELPRHSKGYGRIRV